MLSVDLRRLRTSIFAGYRIVVEEPLLTVVIIGCGNVRVGFPGERFIPDFFRQPVSEVLSLICLVFKQLAICWASFPAPSEPGPQGVPTNRFCRRELLPMSPVIARV